MASKSFGRRALALALGIVFAVGLGEVLVRVALGPPRLLGRPYFRDADGTAYQVEAAAIEAARRGLFEAVPADQTPRPRFRFAPNSAFSMCYEDASILRKPWLDDHGCVAVQINQFGLRERADITPDNKAASERRIVCLGDSFTFGWGVPVEQVWVRRLEEELRRSHGDIRTINCGLGGTLTVDEYWWGLRTRFGAFRPDVVIVSIYLNDLIASEGLCIYGPRPARSPSLLFDYLRAAVARDPLDLDPTVDWVQLALDLPENEGTAMNMYGPDKPFAAMWSQGAPQQALVAMREWCGQHDCKLLVALWPFLQGLGPAADYPFARLHDLVAAFCASRSIPMLDLLPVLDVESAADLWVTPFDKHANPHAHALAVPALRDFVASHLATPAPR